MAKTGLEIIKALDTTAGKSQKSSARDTHPLKKGGAVACDLVTCEQCCWHG